MAETVTYYFDGYDEDGEEWSVNPDKMVDGVLDEYADTNNDGEVQLCNSNTCPATDLGTITKVEIRAYCGDDGPYDDLLRLRPVFAGGDGDNHDMNPPEVPIWSAYVDITSDTNAPSPWTWAAVQALDLDVEYVIGTDEAHIDVSKIEIRVTYSPPAAPGGGDSVTQAAQLLLGRLEG